MYTACHTQICCYYYHFAGSHSFSKYAWVAKNRDNTFSLYEFNQYLTNNMIIDWLICLKVNTMWKAIVGTCWTRMTGEGRKTSNRARELPSSKRGREKCCPYPFAQWFPQRVEGTLLIERKIRRIYYTAQ